MKTLGKQRKHQIENLVKIKLKQCQTYVMVRYVMFFNPMKLNVQDRGVGHDKNS